MNPRIFLLVANGAGVLAMLLGGSVLLSWIFDVRSLWRGIPGFIAMKPNAAVAFVCIGISLVLLIGPSARGRRLGRGLAFVAGGAAVLTLLEYLWLFDLGIDELLAHAVAVPDGTFQSPLMALNTAVSFTFLAGAIALLDAESALLRGLSQALALGALVLGFAETIGHSFGQAGLYGFRGHDSMAMHTALGFVVVSAGVIAARPDRGVAAVLGQDNPAGASARRLLPPLLVVLPAVGWLLLRGHQERFHGAESGLALMVTISTCLLVATTLWNAHLQGGAHRRREQVLEDDRFLLELADLLRTNATSDDMLHRVSTKLGEYLGVSRCLFLEVEPKSDQAVVQRDYFDGLPSLEGRLSLASFTPDSLDEARAGRTVVSFDTSKDRQTSPQFANAYLNAGILARIAVPLIKDGLYVSALIVSSHLPRRWQAREVALVHSVGQRTWMWFEHLRTLEALRQSEVRKAAMLDSAFDAIVSMDGQGVIVELNPSAERLFGHLRMAAIGKHVAELLIPASHRDRFRLEVGPYLDDGSAVGPAKVLEGPALRSDGGEFPTEMVITRVLGQEPPLFTAFVRDITERTRASQGEDRFRLFAEAVKDYSVCVLDREGIVTGWNAGAERLKGYREDEIVGRHFSTFYIPEDVRAGKPTNDLETAAREGSYDLESWRARRDGSRIWANITITPLRNDAGEIVGFGQVTRDMTERLRTERQRELLMERLRALNLELEERVGLRTVELSAALRALEEQNRRVEAANRLKSEFLANMSHELRTPLNGIIGFSELMYDGKVGPLSDDHREYMGDILTSGRHLLQLINDILDLAKIESGKMEFRPEPVDLAVLIQEVRDVLRTMADRKRIAITTDIDPSVNDIVLDPRKLKQVLFNFLSNALKFTPEEGRVTVRVRPEGADDILLEVEDTGIGIRAEDLDQLFTEFHQLDTSIAKKYQGTGLGLALTRRIAEAQGGAVRVRSTPGKGSVFGVLLPRQHKIDPPRARRDSIVPGAHLGG